MSLPREAVQPFTVDGFEFKPREIFFIGFGMPMTNPKYFDSPWEFNPNRFNSALKNPNAFLPFSSGPQNCIGQHMSMMTIRIVLTTILRKYKL